MVQPKTKILVFKNFTALRDIIFISSHNQKWQIYVLEPTSYIMLLTS